MFYSIGVIRIRRKTVRAFIYCHSTKQFLVVKPPFPFKDYSLPGGGIRKGENISEALLREIEEELGFRFSGKVILFLNTISIKSFLKIFYLESTVYFFLLIIDKKPKIFKNWEIRSFIWLDSTQVLDYLSKFFTKPY